MFIMNQKDKLDSNFLNPDWYLVGIIASVSWKIFYWTKFMDLLVDTVVTQCPHPTYDKNT